MIHNDEQLQVVQEQLARVEQALASIRKDILPKNPRNYAVFSESYIDMIRTLRAEIDAYLGLDLTAPSADQTSEQPPSAVNQDADAIVQEAR